MMKTLVVDVGGTHVKMLVSGKRVPVKIDSGPEMTPRRMIADVAKATEGWSYDRVSIGFPGPVKNDRPLHEPWNLGTGWVGFNFGRAFGKPVKLINDAAMQALGSYEGGNMLFLGLGTGLGSTLVHAGVLIPLELAHLPYRDGKSYEAWVGNAGYEELGKKRWRKQVLEVADLFIAALQVDYVVLGGGNARHMKELPKYVRLGSNANAFKGGFRMWDVSTVTVRRR
jgi:polyphosphate glucokinase